MAEGVKIRNLSTTSEVESDDVFILDRKSRIDPSVSVTQSITYDNILSKLTTDIGGGGGGSSDFDPAEGMNYVAFKPSDTPVEIVVTVGPKTAAHRYYNYTDDDGNVAATESYFFDSLEAPFVIFVPGVTYRLDVSDFSNTNYPIRFYVTPTPEFASLGSPIITYNGTAGTAGAYIDINLEGNVDPRIFYLSDTNFYMGNQIFDPGCNDAFENPDFGLPDFGFPVPFTKEEFDALVDRVTLSESKIEDAEQEGARIRDDLQTSVGNIHSITDSLLDRITSQGRAVESIDESQVDLTADIVEVRQEIVDGDNEIKQTLALIQLRLDSIELQLSSLIQVEDQ